MWLFTLPEEHFAALSSRGISSSNSTAIGPGSTVDVQGSVGTELSKWLTDKDATTDEVCLEETAAVSK
jgi:hypothetical protein